MFMLPKKQSGFTIIELLIVIVIIAILAAITLVAYNSVQARAQDSAIRQGAQEFAKAAINWHTLTGKTSPSGGYGSTQALDVNGFCPDGNALGWVAKATYICTFEEELTFQKFLPVGFTDSLPVNKKYVVSNGHYTLMFYPCVIADNSWVVLFYLNNPSTDDTTNYNNLATKCTASNLSGNKSSYGMQGAILVSLN